jgi:hypothetical protein
MISSGDGDPYNDTHAGYDAIFENPIFAGADTSYWIRQTIPFAGGARAVSLNGRNGILANLRSSKEEGQSNFVNPGTLLLGVGADLDITPDFRLSGNRQPSVVPQDRGAGGAAGRGDDPERDRLRRSRRPPSTARTSTRIWCFAPRRRCWCRPLASTICSPAGDAKDFTIPSSSTRS